jgi:hypothetical protein
VIACHRGSVATRLRAKLALHEAVAARLIAEPAILDRARSLLEEWIACGGRSLPLLLRWRDVLSGSIADVAAVLTDRSEAAAWLRSASPFAGALDPHTRLAILRQVRQQFAGGR